MATQALALLPPHYHDSDGALLEGGKVYFYESGSQTIAPVYTDHTGLVEYTQPVVLDLRGEPPTEGIYLDTTRTYKIVIKRPDDTTLKTVDGYNIGGSVGPTGPAGPTGPQGPEGPEGPEGPVVYAEAQQPSFMAQISDVVTYTKSTLILQNETNSFKNWYGPSSIYSTSAHAAILDSQFDRTTLIFTATAAKRWFFTGTASFYNVGTTFPATTCFAIVVKRGSLSEKFIANQGQTSGDAGASSVSVVIDLQVGDQVSFGSNSISARGSYVFSGTQLSIPISQGGSGSDGKVYTSINDTISGFLDSKIVAGGGIALTEVAGTEDKAVEISLNPLITVPVTIQPPVTGSATPVLALITDGVGTDQAFRVSSDTAPTSKNFQINIATDTVEGTYYSFGQGSNKSSWEQSKITASAGAYTDMRSNSLTIYDGTNFGVYTATGYTINGVGPSNSFVPLDGSVPMTGSLEMGSNSIFNGDITMAGDYVELNGSGIVGKYNTYSFTYQPTNFEFQDADYLTKSTGSRWYQKNKATNYRVEAFCGPAKLNNYFYVDYADGTYCRMGGENEPSFYLYDGSHSMRLTTTNMYFDGVPMLKAYTHTQGVADTLWIITHDLGYYPNIQSWNSTGAQITGTIQHVSTSEARITFASSISGGARCV
jgi:hypothetical protein